MAVKCSSSIFLCKQVHKSELLHREYFFPSDVPPYYPVTQRGFAYVKPERGRVVVRCRLLHVLLLYRRTLLLPLGELQ